MLLRIDTEDWWPSSIKDRLNSHRETLLANEYMETLIQSEPFRPIAEELESFIREHRILAYHCTKEPEPGFFAAHGLRILDREKHQTEFLGGYASRFTPAELILIQQEWEKYFSGEQDSGRNGRLWFCLAPNQVVDSGTERLFKFFGGETIYMPLIHHRTIAAKLCAIGNPVVVETSIDPNELRTFSQVPFAFNAMSLFHRRVNAAASINGREGYLSRNVTPEEILRVRPRDLFFNTYSKCYSS